MVQVVIGSYKNSNKRGRLVCLDFQGNFDRGEERNLESLEVGNLSFEKDSATLTTGHHCLVGKKVKLSKPFAVIHKRSPDIHMVESGAMYEVVTILKEKYVFSSRPGFIVQEDLRGLTKMNKSQ